MNSRSSLKSAGLRKQSMSKNRPSSSDSDRSRKSFRRSSSSSSNDDSFLSDSSNSGYSQTSIRKKGSLPFMRSRESLRSSKRSTSNVRRSSSRSRSSSRDFSSSESLTNLSKANSLKNLEAEYEPIASNLNFNIYQALFSIKSSNLRIYTLTKEYQENSSKQKRLVEKNAALKEENVKIADQMVNESSGAVSLVEVIYGSIHWKLAKEYTNLALIYLDFKNMAKQAREQCQKAWSILVEDFKHKKRMEEIHGANFQEAEHENNAGGSEEDKSDHIYPDCSRHQMMLNYIYGRASTILKENEEGQVSLESANEYCNQWQKELKMNKLRYLKYKKELNTWKQKIYYALAKQYAINNSDRNAFEFYDMCLNVIGKKREKTMFDEEMSIKIYKDKSKIELNKGGKESFLKAIDYAKAAIQIAEEQQETSLVWIGDTKLNLAKIFAQKDDMNSSNKAEELFKEVVGTFTKASESVNEHMIKAKDELVKFYLKEQRYDDAIINLNELAKEKCEFYGDFSLKLDPTYKLLCSTYLVKNDMPTAAKHLQKSLEVEEINYGTKDKRYLETKEMLDNLKKNPNVQKVLKGGSNAEAETANKPFHVKKKIDYSKSDNKLFSPINAASNDADKTIQDESFVNKKINPIK